MGWLNARLSVVTDDMIIAALNREYRFTFEVVRNVFGKQIKSANPHFRARLRRLVTQGAVEAEPDKMRGQERWRRK